MTDYTILYIILEIGKNTHQQLSCEITQKISESQLQLLSRDF